jgi:cytochrome c peroxidase
MRGQDIFFGKGHCATCHTPPYYTDDLMHNLQVERFYKPVMINGMLASSNGPIKTFPLRGIKDSPPYLHDGRLPTLDDTVEFFNLVLGTKLAPQEKQDLVAFLRTLQRARAFRYCSPTPCLARAHRRTKRQRP